MQEPLKSDAINVRSGEGGVVGIATRVRAAESKKAPGWEHSDQGERRQSKYGMTGKFD